MKRFLIVVDMQNDFIDGSLGTKEAQAIVPAAVDKIQSFNGEIFATLDTHYDDYLTTAEGRKLPVSHCIKDTHGWELNSDIQQALDNRGYTAVEKNTFGSVDLPKLIADATGGEDFEIEIIGLCTDICVVSNALLLKAHFPESLICVDSFCCAGVTRELHEAALDTMRSCRIEIL